MSVSMTSPFKAVLGCLVWLAASAAWAQTTPAGLWKTIDDESKTEKSYVRIVDVGGVMHAKTNPCWA
jgi:hypothetical protein